MRVKKPKLYKSNIYSVAYSSLLNMSARGQCREKTKHPFTPAFLERCDLNEEQSTCHLDV